MVNRRFNSYGFNNGIKQPCVKDYQDRKVGCHSTCEKYKEFIKENSYTDTYNFKTIEVSKLQDLLKEEWGYERD